MTATMSEIGSTYDALNQSFQDSESDPRYSALASPDKSLASSHDRSTSRGRPRKRKIKQNFMSSQPSSKRVKSSYNDDYRVLFNSTVKEVESKSSSETDDVLEEGQIGVTVWSSGEKAAFFRSLTRRGRQDIQSIATDIGSKSESEVCVYSDILLKAAVGQQTYGTHEKSLDTSDLKAALEVRGDCCAALDLAAEALSALRQIEEETAEKKRHKDLAILTPKIARWVERYVAVDHESNDEVSQRIPTAKLLNLMNFLALSKRFFMNSVIVEDNWRSYATRSNNSPSILYTAFSDFHAITISITQRLVQSSLFFAMSRLRAISASGQFKPRSHVKRRDVMAALNVLGMKPDAKTFWAGMARKCKLRVYDKVRQRQVFGRRYSYVEVERLLCPSRISDRDSSEMMTEDVNTSRSRKSRAPTVSSATTSKDSFSSDSISIEADWSSPQSNDEGLLGTPLDPTKKQDSHGPLLDAYLEALDQQASLNEERRLWEMLGNDPAEKMQSVDWKRLNSPFSKRRHKEHLTDWRDGLDYAENWETHDILAYGNEFANHQRFTKNADFAAGLANPESSSDSFVNVDSTEEEHDSESDQDADGDGAANADKANASSADDDGR